MSFEYRTAYIATAIVTALVLFLITGTILSW